MQLKSLLQKYPNAVLIDAYGAEPHRTLPASTWLPDIGQASGYGEQGFKDRIAKVHLGIKIVDERYGWADFSKSLAVSENILTAHPELHAIFASNESSTVGAAQALKGRKSKVKLVGFDSSPQMIEDMKAGVIDSLVIQNPFRMGYEATKAAVDQLEGRPVIKINNLPPKLIALADLANPEVQEQLNPDLKKYLD